MELANIGSSILLQLARARVNIERETVKIASTAFIVIFHHLKKKVRKTKKRHHWVTPVLKSRDLYGGNQLLNDLLIGSTGQFGNFCHMSSEDFEHLLTLIEPAIRKQDTNYRIAISSKERLAITLHFLARGDSYISLMYLFKISKQSISQLSLTFAELSMMS
jgi:hypothetical protein